MVNFTINFKEKIRNIQLELKNSNFQKAENLCKELLEQKPNYQERILLLDLLAKVFRMDQNLEQAEHVLESLIQLFIDLENSQENRKEYFEKYIQQHAFTLQNLALLQSQLKKYTLALEKAKDALILFERIKEKGVGDIVSHNNTALANAIIVLSSVYYEMNDLSNAKVQITKALEILRQNQSENSFAISTCLNNLGRIYEHFEDYTQAHIAYEEAVARRREIAPRSLDTAFCLGNYGASLTAGGVFLKGMQVLEESISIYTEHGLLESEYVKSHQHNLNICKRSL